MNYLKILFFTLSIMIGVASLAMFIIKIGKNSVGNQRCDDICKINQYPAGELAPHVVHRVCVCWPIISEEPKYFLLERR